MDTPLKERLYTGQFLSMIKLNGYEMVERINCSGVVALIPVTTSEELVLVEQFRVPVQRSVIELPAGLVNDIPGMPRESLEEGAKRELLEETGYKATSLVEVGQWPMSCGMSSEVVTVYVAKDVIKVASGGGDETESITVHVVPLAKMDAWLDQMIASGRYIDPKIYSALYLL